MSLLSAAEILEMRALCGEAFDSTAVIQGGTIVDNQGGGGSLSWLPAGTVPCHLAPILARGEREPVTGGRINPDSDWILTLPAETAIETENRVVIASETFEVAALRAPRTWELTRRVELTKVDE